MKVRRIARVSCTALTLLSILILATVAVAEEPPLPRFASLSASSVEVYTGPGRHYPVRWVFERYGYPVKIVDQHEEIWRKVEDVDGEGGWIHRGDLSPRRMVMVVGGNATMRRTPSAAARAVLYAEPGVLGRLLRCDPSWCLVEIDATRGWIERPQLWGVLTSETTLTLD